MQASSGGGNHEQTLASQELVQCSSCAGVSTSALIQRKLYQGVEEPGSPLGLPLSAGATPELHGPQQCQPEGRHHYSHPLQPGSAVPPGSEVIRHVPSGQQVGNLGQLLEAVVQWSTRPHEVRYSRHNVRKQE